MDSRNIYVTYVNEEDDCLQMARGSDLTVLSLNIRSLVNKLGLLELFLSSIAAREKQVDVLFLSETFLKAANVNFYNIDGYKAYHFPRESRNGGGISFFIKEDLKVDYKIQKFSCREVQFLILNLPEIHVKLCGIYRPPTSQYSNIREFLDLYDQILENNKNMITVGDVNIDLLDQRNVEFNNLITSNNFKILNNIHADYYTRRDATSCTILDHVHTDITSQFALQIGESALSDHRYLLLILFNAGISNTKTNVTKKYVNYARVRENLERQAQVGFDNFDQFHGFLKSLVTQETKTKAVQINYSNYYKPWADLRLQKLLRLKKKFDKLRKQFPSNEYFSAKFHELRKYVKKEVDKSKKTYYSSLYKENINNSKKIWQITREILCNKKMQFKSKELELRINGKLTSNSLHVANEINNYFSTVGSLQCVNRPQYECFEFNQRTEPITMLTNFEPTDSEELKEIIMRLGSNKASGYDEIPTKFLKDNVEFLSVILATFINDSFQNGEFPDSLKFARIMPLFKDGDSSDVSNYRPISILPAVSKVFEFAIKVRLIKHLEDNKLIHPNQYGFLRHSNTTAASSCLVDDVVSGLNNKMKTACIYIDVKKAFDCLEFKTLKILLEKLGIQGKALDVLKNYLQCRKQIVEVNGVKSSVADIVSGAAQGSVLGPILFLIYINDLLYLKLNSTGRLFADDAAFLYRAVDYRTLHDLMQKDLLVIESFLLSINLTMSIKKTKFMIFRTVNSSSVGLFDKIHFSNKYIELVSEFKYLGLIIDTYLNWKSHVNHVATAIAPFIGVIGRVRYFVNRNVLMQLYYSYIHSRLTYCLAVWSGCSLELKMRLQRLQNKVIKLISFKPYLTPSETLYNNQFLSFLKLCDYESILFLYKVKAGLVRSDITLKTNTMITCRETRQSSQLRPPLYVMAKSQSSVFYHGIKKYNDFSEQNNISSEKSLSRIKHLIKTFVYSTY